MGVCDAPQWLLPSFIRSVTQVGGTASADEIEDVGTALIARWNDPSRVFHNLKHLVAVLARVDELAEETHHPDLVRLAAWYHSAAFRPHEQEWKDFSELESAETALTELRGLGVPEAKARRVHDLVVSLARHVPPPGDMDAAALSDADLGILAAEPQVYQGYVAKLRAEYDRVPTEAFLAGRIAFVSTLLSRREIFHSPKGAAWEDTARQNLAGELARLRKALAAAQAERAAAEADAAAAGGAGAGVAVADAAGAEGEGAGGEGAVGPGAAVAGDPGTPKEPAG